MKRALLAGALVALAVAPQGAAAAPSTPDRQNAAKDCRTERGSTPASRLAFRVMHGTNKNGKNAFGKCVSKAARAEERQRRGAVINAAKACMAERAANPALFQSTYGTSPNVKYGNPFGGNAFGKCVSQKARANKRAADAADATRIAARRKAARTCARTVGTKRRSAFRRCVSKKAKARTQS